MKNLLRRKEFWAALVAMIMVILKAFVPGFPLSESQVLELVLAIVGLIIGISFSDVAVALREHTTAMTRK